MYLEQVPILVLEKLVLDHLDFSSIKSLRVTNIYFRDLIDNIVINELVLPHSNDMYPLIRRPVLKLTINFPFDQNVRQTNERLTELVHEISKFNVAKTGDLKFVLTSTSNVIWPDITRLYYHYLFVSILEKLEHNYIRNLEIQLDFLCDKCRSFLEKLPEFLIFSKLEKLKVVCINYNTSPTVGLYVHFLKMIFRFRPLKIFQLENIPSDIIDDLKEWFLPGNMYFSQIRKFAFHPKLPFNRLLFHFDILDGS